MVLEKTLERPLDCKEIQPVHSEGNQPWVLAGPWGRAWGTARCPLPGRALRDGSGRWDRSDSWLGVGQRRGGVGWEKYLSRTRKMEGFSESEPEGVCGSGGEKS